MSDQKPRLFISHSSKTPENLALLEELISLLKTKGFHVLVDQDGAIPPNERWRQYLAEWILECDAAIILFSRAAARESDWVRAESAILGWRRQIEKEKFRLLSVALEDLGDAELDRTEYFKATGIGAFERIRDAATAEEICAKVVGNLADLQPETSPFDSLRIRIARILDGLHRESQDDAIKDMVCDDKPKARAGYNQADAIARILLRNPPGALGNLNTLFLALRGTIHFDARVARDLRDICLGMWVDPESASSLACCYINPDPRPAALNGEFFAELTADSYGRRVWPFPETHRRIDVTQPRFEDIEQALFSTFGVETQPEDRARQAVRNFDRGLLLLIAHKSEGGEVPDQTFLDQLKTVYPNLSILLHTGTHPNHELGDAFRCVDPPVDVDVEHYQHVTFTNINHLITDIG